MRPLHILVVDDEGMVRETLSLLLQIDHHVVETASNASEALGLFQPGKFDLVITDYDMPGMKGDQLVATIKAQAPTQPVVMLTAYVEALQTNQDFLRSLDGLIPKPFRIETLRQTIADVFAARGCPTTPPIP